jgi:hypothetical protein
MDDIVLRTKIGTLKKDSKPSFEDVMGALKGVYAPRALLTVQQKVAAA